MKTRPFRNAFLRWLKNQFRVLIRLPSPYTSVYWMICQTKANCTVRACMCVCMRLIWNTQKMLLVHDMVNVERHQTVHDYMDSIRARFMGDSLYSCMRIAHCVLPLCRSPKHVALAVCPCCAQSFSAVMRHVVMTLCCHKIASPIRLYSNSCDSDLVLTQNFDVPIRGFRVNCEWRRVRRKFLG